MSSVPPPADDRDAGLEAGESRLADLLERELLDSDAVVAHHLSCGAVGDIDHLVVGPGGVTVIVAEHAAGHGRQGRGGHQGRGGRQGRGARQARRRRDETVARVGRQRLAVRLALAHIRPELRNVNVIGILCAVGEEFLPASELEDGVTLAGAVAAAHIANRHGELTAADIAELERTVADHLSRVTREQIEGRAGQARPASVSGLRVPARRLSGRSVATVVVTTLLAAIGLEAALFVSKRLGGPPPPDITAVRDHDRTVLYVAAPDGETLRLRITAGRSTRSLYFHSRGTAIRWVASKSLSQAALVTVTACAVSPDHRAGRCIGPLSGGTIAGP